MNPRQAHPVSRTSRAARRGFSVLELMMATAIGAVILLAALGVFGLMERMDRFHSDRFRESSDTVFAHTVVRRAMQTMVAKAPIAGAEDLERATGVDRDQVRPRDAGPDDGNDQLREEMAKRINPMLHGRRGEYKDDRDQKTLTLDQFGRTVFPKSMFVLEPSGVLTTSSADAPSRLELTMLAQPAPGAPGSVLFVRGAFEVEPRRKGWALLYRPILPEGEPIELLDGVTALEWQVLVRGNEAGKSLFERSSLRRGEQSETEDKGGVWQDAMSAETPAEFPKAIRLRALLSTGRSIDWLFEPSITTGGTQ